MNFNFHDKYKDYSNTDLLKIIRRPNEYQPGAVEAAELILKTREITETDIFFVDAHFNEIDSIAKQKAEKMSSYKDQVIDFLDPVLNPGTEFTPAKWLKLLLIVIVLDYLWKFYKGVKSIVFLSNCLNCSFNTDWIPILMNLFYIPVVFYLLYTKNRWGWILLFADNLFAFLSKLGQSYFFFQHFNEGWDSASLLFSIFIKAAFIFFLWRSPVPEFFGVSFNTKRNTALAVTIFAITFIASMTSLYR